MFWRGIWQYSSLEKIKDNDNNNNNRVQGTEVDLIVALYYNMSLFYGFKLDCMWHLKMWYVIILWMLYCIINRF